MLSDDIRAYLLPRAFNAAVRAGWEIMEVYKNRDDYDISVKSDHTPITIADRLAHEKIKESLGQTRIPILSEEGREMLYDERRNWELFWLVDPLDGTVEFIKGNNEFTVNIALMSERQCICAVIYVPYLQKVYVASRGVGSFLIEGIAPAADACYSYDDICALKQRLPLASSLHTDYRIAVSRSHQTPETEEYIDAIKAKYQNVRIIEQGSSYKFCLLAEGLIDYYPRTTHTYEWDTAAAELILSEAGGITRSLPDRQPLLYNKENLQNPWFECILL
ncbi:MAG: 3'(2'),5'-bisphosphate nucleotidase CysQ [Alistipes sp.]|nr:3'(2'),5'-bisphosphate nucleotidase CysQ [Alistipes sp.]MEE0916085.1 3'(2'),5'-bisphosphate nucleotidase CysQ [Alistipes sp.]